MEPKRWKAIVAYRCDDARQIYRFEELRELHDLIEDGPNFQGIESIVITYQHRIDAAAEAETVSETPGRSDLETILRNVPRQYVEVA